LRDTSRRLRIENEKREDIRNEVHPESTNTHHLFDDPEFSRKEFEQQLSGALKKLNLLERSILLAHYIDGLTVASIASMHRTSMATVNRTLRKALDFLREELGHETQRQ